jgi:hypothetical protein
MAKPWLGWILTLLLLIFILWFIEKWNDFRKRKRKDQFYNIDPSMRRSRVEETCPQPPRPLTLESSQILPPVIIPQPPTGMKISNGQLRACTVLQNKLGLPLKWNDRSQTWNKNPRTGRNLELDCWCPEKKIALEFQGRQHNEFPNRFHKTREEFEDSIRRDLIKKDNCRKNGVYLIEVSEKTKPDEAEAYINLHVSYWLSLQKENQVCELEIAEN